LNFRPLWRAEPNRLRGNFRLFNIIDNRPAAFEPKSIEPRTFAPEVRELLERATAPPRTNLATNKLDDHTLDDETDAEKEPDTDLVAIAPPEPCSSAEKMLVGGVRQGDRVLEPRFEPPPRWITKVDIRRKNSFARVKSADE